MQDFATRQIGRVSTRARLAEDVVMGIVIQTMKSGPQTVLKGFLLESTAGMLRVDALVIAGSAALAMLLRRTLTLASFGPECATSNRQNVARTDLTMMGIGLAVTVVGFEIVGLILIGALLIIPPVTARFSTERRDHIVLISGVLGGILAHRCWPFCRTFWWVRSSFWYRYYGL